MNHWWETQTMEGMHMAGYCWFDVVEVSDPPKMQEYRDRIGEIVAIFGGRYLAVGGPFDVVEGEWRPVFPVLIEFPSLELAHRWYDSPEYQELKALRLAATNCNAVFIQGL